MLITTLTKYTFPIGRLSAFYDYSSINMEREAIIKMRGLKLAKGVRKIGERSDERGINVSGRFGLLEIRSLIWKSVVPIGPSDHRADENVRLGELEFMAEKPEEQPILAGCSAMDGSDEPLWWILCG